MTENRKKDFASNIHDRLLPTITFKKSISDEIIPFLDRLRMMSKADLRYFKEAFVKFKERNEVSSQKVNFILRGGLEHLNAKMPLNEQIVDLFFYLGFVESLGNCYVDILVMLLITSGRDFHIESRFSTPRIKHVISIDDLEKEKVPLAIKLNFLGDNGIKSFSKVIDSKLRNDIAHFNFEIVQDKVLIRGKPVNNTVHTSYHRLILATSVIDELLHSLASDFGWEKKSKNINIIEQLLKQFSEMKDSNLDE